MNAVASSMRGQKIRLAIGASDAVTPSVPKPQISRHPTITSISKHQSPSSIASLNHTQWPPTSASFPPARAPRRVSSAPSTTRPPTLRTRLLSAVSWSSVYVSSFRHFGLLCDPINLTNSLSRPVSRSSAPASESSSFLRKSHPTRIHQEPHNLNIILTHCSM